MLQSNLQVRYLLTSIEDCMIKALTIRPLFGPKWLQNTFHGSNVPAKSISFQNCVFNLIRIIKPPQSFPIACGGFGEG